MKLEIYDDGATPDNRRQSATETPDCADCRHFRSTICGAPEGLFTYATGEREYGNCGAEGKLWVEREPSIFDAWD